MKVERLGGGGGGGIKLFDNALLDRGGGAKKLVYSQELIGLLGNEGTISSCSIGGGGGEEIDLKVEDEDEPPPSNPNNLLKVFFFSISTGLEIIG